MAVTVSVALASPVGSVHSLPTMFPLFDPVVESI